MGKDLKGKELGKGLDQIKDGKYRARYTTKLGKRLEKKSGKLQVVKAWLEDTKYIDEHCNVAFASQMSVDAWYDYWISIKEKTVRPNTVRNYRERYEKNIRPVIGYKLLFDVEPIDCQRIFTEMGEQNYKNSTIYQTRIALYNMLEFALDNEIIRRNPCKKSLRSNVGLEPEKKEALTIEEQRKFLAEVVGRSYENQFRFILQTGLRAGELVGLTWSAIDFEKKTIKVFRTVEYRAKSGTWQIGPPKSKSGLREIPLTEEAIRLLRVQKEKNSKLKVIALEWKDTVFLCKKGTPVKNSTYDSALFKICNAAGIRVISMHILRHTFATRCIEAGMRPKTLQMILGHSSLQITMDLYVHVTGEEKQNEIQKIEESLLIM